VIVPAYAKLNLTLDVLGRRPDGYHEIASVMQTISLHDLVAIDPADCRSFRATGIAVDGDNLVLAAARELEAWAGRALPMRIHLHKRIPVGAGLGGGSADAAACLRLAVRAFQLPIPFDTLLEIAARLGKDVPFFLTGGTAVASGDGSTIAPLPPLSPPAVFVVVCPPLPVSTRAVYEAVGERPSARRTPQLAEALRRGGPVRELLGNDLEAVSLHQVPQLHTLIAGLRARLPQLHMTGTGSAFYALIDDPAAASETARWVNAQGARAEVCRAVGSWSWSA
jgi:4-diphosphocytidyl-2-C-methyl-D-erythritol kinase